MISAMKFPASYFQGKDALCEFEAHTRCYGRSFLFIGSKSALKAAQGKLEDSFAHSESTIRFELTSGVPCASEIGRLRQLAAESGAEAICAVGGGGVMDIVRSIAMALGRAMIMIPTAVASDAPCTYVSVLYAEDGAGIVGDEQFYKCPDMVYVDASVVAQAPLRLTVAGMGDALATAYEAESCLRSGTPAGGQYGITATAMILGKACREIIFQNGPMASVAAREHVVTPALERVIEANCFLSGIGGLNSGCAGAHGIGDCLSALPGGHDYLHGERVAVGLVIQLILEGYPQSEIERVAGFGLDVGLPVSVRDLGFADVEAVAAEIGRVAQDDHFVVHMTCDHSAGAIAGAVTAAVALTDEMRQKRSGKA